MAHTQYQTTRLPRAIEYVFHVFRKRDEGSRPNVFVEREDEGSELHHLDQDVNHPVHNCFFVAEVVDRSHSNVGERGQIGATSDESVRITCSLSSC